MDVHILKNNFISRKHDEDLIKEESFDFSRILNMNQCSGINCTSSHCILHNYALLG